MDVVEKNACIKTEFKVIHFILDHRIGGPHVYVKTLAGAYKKEVNSVLATTGFGPATDFELFNLRRWFRPLYILEVPLNAILIVGHFGLFRRPSLFHVHGAANIAPLLAAFLCRMPVVWHFHETLECQRSIARLGTWLIKRTCHRTLTVAAAAREIFGQPNALLAFGAVDITFWNPLVVGNYGSNETSINGKVWSILAVANLNPLKGIDILIDCLPLTHLAIELKIVGAELDTQSNYINSIRRRAAEVMALCPKISIRFLGGQQATRIREYLASCDIFVMPSRSEAGPLVVLEAMAMARPVVATDVGSVREFLPLDQQVFICEPENSNALALAIKEMSRLTCVEREGLGQKNREAVEFHSTPAHLAEIVLKSYRSLVNAK